MNRKFTTAHQQGAAIAVAITIGVALSTPHASAEVVDVATGDAAEEAAKPVATRPANLEEIIDGLPQNSLQEAFRLLRTDYIQADQLNYLELNRSALQGLLGRLEFGATLLSGAGRAAANSPFNFHAQALTRHAAYVRPGKFVSDDIDALDAALEKYNADEELDTLIIDLRSPQHQADFNIAARFLSRFLGSGDLLFKIKRPGENRPTLFLAESAGQRWEKDVLILIDRETGNVGEIIAAVLRRENDALVIGEPTLGLTVEYRDVPLGEDRFLRYAVAEVLLADDTSLFKKGVNPDLPGVTTAKKKHEIFAATDEHDLKTFLVDEERPRVNEAALVAGTNPELDYFLAKSKGEATPYDQPPLQDRALQQALDLLATKRFFGQNDSTKKSAVR